MISSALRSEDPYSPRDCLETSQEAVGCTGEKPTLWPEAWIQFFALSLLSFVTLDKLLQLSDPQIPQMGANDGFHPILMLWGLHNVPGMWKCSVSLLLSVTEGTFLNWLSWKRGGSSCKTRHLSSSSFPSSFLPSSNIYWPLLWMVGVRNVMQWRTRQMQSLLFFFGFTV